MALMENHIVGQRAVLLPEAVVGGSNELRFGEEFRMLQSEMVAVMDSLRSPSSGFYHDWQDTEGHNSCPTLLPNNAYGMFSELVAYKTGKRSREATVERLSLTLSTLEHINNGRYSGFFPSIYETDTATPIEDSLKLSAVDNAHVFLANIAAGDMLPELREKTQSINGQMDFKFFLDPKMGLLHGAYLPNSEKFLSYHDGALDSETRLAAYIYMVQSGDYGIYNRLYRNIPKEYTERIPVGNTVHPLKHKPPYETNGANLFEDAVPLLFVPEEIIDPKWALQHREMVAAEIEYAEFLKGLWGHVPADKPSSPEYDYVVAGIPELAANSAHVVPEIVSPFACLLVTQLFPDEVARNLRNFVQQYPNIYEPGKGFKDSVDIKNDQVATRYLAINVGTALVALGNYLNEGFIRNLTSKFFEPIYPTIASEESIH